MKLSEYLYFPTKKGEFLKDSKGKTRMYKSAKKALSHLNKANKDYDFVLIYKIDDVVSKEELELFAGQKGTEQ
jgi:hypothetical protein